MVFLSLFKGTSINLVSCHFYPLILKVSPIGSLVESSYICIVRQTKMNLGLVNDFKYRVMKLKNILSIICFLFVVASCSVEDDTIMNDVTNNIENNEVSGSAYVSVSVKSEQSATKATTGNSSKPSDYSSHPISNCYLLLLDDDSNILYRAFNDWGDNPVTNVSFEDFKILVKLKSVTKVIAVINGSSNFRSKMDGCVSLSDLAGIREEDAGSVLSFGEGSIDWTGVKGSESTKNDVPVVKVSGITAKFRIANVELSKFNIKYFDCNEESYKVQLDNFWLTGMKSSVGLYDEGENAINNESPEDNISFVSEDNSFDNLRTNKDKYSKENSEEFILEKFNLIQEWATFRYVFPNTDGENKVTAHLRFSVTTAHGKKYYEREYIVNRPSGDGFTNNSGTEYVNPGYWYQLNVTVHVKKDFIDCAFTCSTKDWIYNEINVDL